MQVLKHLNYVMEGSLTCAALTDCLEGRKSRLLKTLQRTNCVLNDGCTESKKNYFFTLAADWYKQGRHI
jgi:hypothetical protein